MRRSTGALLSALLVLVALPAVAGASHDGEPHPPLYRGEQVFFQCHGGDEEKNQNLYDSSEWSTSPPSRSVIDGAGCGYVNSGAIDDRPTFEGTFRGNLRDLRVEMHIFPSVLHPLTLAQGNINLHVTLAIDGDTAAEGTLTGVPVTLSGSPFPPGPNYGTTQTVVFGISGLAEDFGQEEDFGTITREISLSVGTASPQDIIDWVWDTTEVPAGITFNQAASPALPAG